MNVLLISLDTLRADHLSCYGYPRLTSPHIDRLAAGGSLFRTCVAPHIPTHPGHTTAFTGQDVFAHQVVSHGGQLELDPGVPLLAERLRAAGYFTGAADNLGRWFSRGFDLYEGYRWESDPKGRWRKGEAVNAAAERVLAQAAAQDKPFFCFLHYWDVHTPYLPPDPFWGMFYDGDAHDSRNHSMDALWAFEPFRWYFHEWMPGVTDIAFPMAQYDAELAYMDTCLGHLFHVLHARGLDRDTLVVLFADHGEELDEHAMWFDHHGLYETNVHVPLIFWAPGRVPARTWHGPVSHYDIVPTVLEAAGLEAAGLGLAGQSLWPTMRGGPDAGTWDGLYLTECSWMRKHAWRTREWKLIRALEPDFHHCPSVELYHLVSDPREQRNLAAERPDVVAELQRALDAHVAARVQATGRPAPIMVQGVTMRRIGNVQMAVPANMKLAPEPVASAEPPAAVAADAVPASVAPVPVLAPAPAIAAALAAAGSVGKRAARGSGLTRGGAARGGGGGAAPGETLPRSEGGRGRAGGAGRAAVPGTAQGEAGPGRGRPDAGTASGAAGAAESAGSERRPGAAGVQSAAPGAATGARGKAAAGRAPAAGKGAGSGRASGRTPASAPPAPRAAGARRPRQAPDGGTLPPAPNRARGRGAL